MPQEDTIPNKLIIEEPLKMVEQLKKENRVNLTLPPDCDFMELSFTDNRAELQKFIEMHYGNKTWKVLLLDRDIDKLIAQKNAHVFAIRWRSMIIAIQTLEIFDVQIYDSIKRGGYTDYLLIHPKFRNKGLNNVLTAMVFIESVKLGCDFNFYNTHVDLGCKSYLSRPMYEFPLTNIPLLAGIARKDASHPFKILNHTLRKATIDEMRKFNEVNHKIHILFSEDNLKAFDKYDRTYTNGHTILRFVELVSNLENMNIRSALLVNWINVNDKAFFKEVIEELRKDGFDTVSFASDGTLGEIISYFGFDKNLPMRQYSVNILPKAPKGEIGLMVR